MKNKYKLQISEAVKTDFKKSRKRFRQAEEKREHVTAIKQNKRLKKIEAKNVLRRQKTAVCLHFSETQSEQES